MRLFVLRLLLLSVFFNTAIGMPLHGAAHLGQAALGSAQAWTALNRCEQPEPAHARPAGQPGELAESVDGVCAWCLAHAPESAALPMELATRMACGAAAALAPPRTAAAWIPGQGRWAFASRDPPR